MRSHRSLCYDASVVFEIIYIKCGKTPIFIRNFAENYCLLR